jgi:hypothetical protein
MSHRSSSGPTKLFLKDELNPNTKEGRREVIARTKNAFNKSAGCECTESPKMRQLTIKFHGRQVCMAAARKPSAEGVGLLSNEGQGLFLSTHPSSCPKRCEPLPIFHSTGSCVVGGFLQKRAWPAFQKKNFHCTTWAGPLAACKQTTVPWRGFQMAVCFHPPQSTLRMMDCNPSSLKEQLPLNNAPCDISCW